MRIIGSMLEMRHFASNTPVDEFLSDDVGVGGGDFDFVTKMAGVGIESERDFGCEVIIFLC